MNTTTQGFRISASTGLHKGDRAYQQDQIELLVHPRIPGCALGLVADGMGGKSGGRTAADQVVMTARQVFERFSPQRDDPTAMLTSLVVESHLMIKLTAITAEEEPHSTLAAFLVMPSRQAFTVHAGDSRIYHFHNGRLVKRTMDHSYVQTLVRQGKLSAVGLPGTDKGTGEYRKERQGRGKLIHIADLCALLVAFRNTKV